MQINECKIKPDGLSLEARFAYNNTIYTIYFDFNEIYLKSK